MPLLSAITWVAYSDRRRSSSVRGTQVGTSIGLPSASSRATNTITQCVHRRSSPPIGSRACTSTARSEEHTSELQSLMRISYAVFCLKNKINQTHTRYDH